MSISATVRNHLETSNTAYQLVPHPRTYTSPETAEAAHVPGDLLVKAVVVRGNGDYALVLLPSTHRIDLGTLHERLGHLFALADEPDIRKIFTDCEAGSIPPFGQVYGLEVLVDDSLLDREEIYFEGGDHEELVQISGSDFARLIGAATHGSFGRHS